MMTTTSSVSPHGVAALSKGPFIRRKLLAQRLDLEETMMAGLARITM